MATVVCPRGERRCISRDRHVIRQQPIRRVRAPPPPVSPPACIRAYAEEITDYVRAKHTRGVQTAHRAVPHHHPAFRYCPIIGSGGMAASQHEAEPVANVSVIF